jgi:Ca-activated chloride channel family protein
MPGKTDFYALLGVSRNATPEEIKRAYFDAARRLHPDKNKAPGETEFFLEIQQAYETLSDPKRRAAYDAALPPETETPTGPLRVNVDFSRPSLVRMDEPQLLYVLMDIAPSENSSATAVATPLNVCLVLDRSTSMQGEKLDVVKATTIQLIRMLQSQDILGVVAFSDRAEVLIPCGYQNDRSRLEARIQMLNHGGGTEIFQGLSVGLEEVRRNADPRRVNHVILLTDGHTYGDETACLALADEAARQNIGISGFGIGKDWNDTFLDSLTSRTGGSSAYVSRPQEIQRLLIEKFTKLGRVFAEEVQLDFKAVPGVDLNYVFRLQPEAGPLPLESPIPLGPILQDVSLTVLFEFAIQPSALETNNLQFLDGVLKNRIPSLPLPVPPVRLLWSRRVTKKPVPEPPPLTIVQAMSRLSLYRIQEKAHAAANAGDYVKASRHLQTLASHLLAQGEQGLAHTALLEAENILKTQAFSEEGKKEIKYGTRALCLPSKA